MHPKMRRVLAAIAASGGGGAVPAFNPADLFLAGTVPGVHYHTGTLSSLFEDRSLTPTTPASVNGVVGTRKDLSGNGNHQIALTDAGRGILRTDGAGHYWVEYDTIDDRLRCNATLAAVGVTGAVFMGLGMLNSSASLSFAGIANSVPYLGISESGNAARPDSGSGTPTYNVNGIAVTATRAAMFVAAASALGATPRLIEARSTVMTGYVAATVGAYGGFGGVVRDYGITIISETALGSNESALRTWYGQQMGVAIP